MKYIVCALLSLVLAAPVAAHPHIFIDTGLDLEFDENGQLTQLKVTWSYDEFYSLLVTEDMELDGDFDGVLTPAEQARLTGFDMQWVPGFNGDLVIVGGDGHLKLSGPLSPTAELKDGRIITTHVRTVAGNGRPLDSWQIKPFDETFYTAYDVTLPVVIRGGGGCQHRVEVPELTTGLLALKSQLNALDADTMPEDVGLPNLGEQLSSVVIVTCGAS